MERPGRREGSRPTEEIKPLQKTFLAVRGEIALRAAKTFAKRGIAAVIPYTFSDSNPLASELVDQNQDKGWELAALGGTSADENFTNPKILIETMKLHGCDSVFLGYGFLSEDAEFVKMCEDEGIRVLAPPSKVMEKVGNKISARQVARATKIRPWFGWSNISVIEGSENLPDIETATKTAAGLGYPVMLKDPDSGGGAGNVVCRDERELVTAFGVLKERPENKQLFLERFVENAIHVEVQIAADKYKHVVSLGERDCTMQRRSQKVLEESPSPHISKRLRGVLQQTAVSFAQAVGYEGVGTVEFLVDLDREGRGGDPEWSFMEMNDRLQVEHGVTEEQLKDLDIDIVGLMIDIAEGKPLSFTQKDIKPSGHTIEARVYAENPDRGFARDSGVVSVFRYPKIDGMRIEPALREGDELSAWYDHTLLKAISHAETRELAREQLVRLLSGTEIMGVSSNLHFLTELLSTDEFRNGKKGTTTFVENWWRQRLRDRVHDIAEFINGGTFTPHEASSQYNPQAFPQTSTVISRRNEQEITYQDHVDRLIKDKGTACSSEYGIQERDGVQWVLYKLDFSINAGVLGPQEGNMFVDACKLAHEKGLDLVTLISTGGADQWTNTLALHQMTRTVAALKRYPPKSYINVSHGPDYGGVPASFEGAPDFQIMVDSDDSKKGFSGIFLLAKNAGINLPENTRAAEAYRILAEADPKFRGVHSALKHFEDRNIDYVATDLADASDKVAQLIHSTATEEVITDPTRVYEPHELIALREGSSEATRSDRPGIFSAVWLGPISRLRDRMIDQRLRGRNAPPLTNYERWKMIHEVTRPTAADLLDRRFGLFDDAVLLTGPILHFDQDEYYPSIIAAIARIENFRLLVVAEQTQRVVDELTGKMVKRYNPQKPEDWEALEHFVLGLGLKNRLPLLTIVDTEGADPSPTAESRGQSRKIFKTIKIRNDYPYTNLALLPSLKGSGGGEDMFSPVDGAAMAENGLAFVSDPRTKSWIQGGHWFDRESEEFINYINGESTARAETLKTMGLIDYIVLEGSGGAHRNPTLFARNIRAWLLPELRRDALLSLTEREKRRWIRNEEPNRRFNLPT